MSPAGEIIYKAFAPTIKMMLCIGIGVIITKRGLFQPQMAKGVSVLAMNVGLPSLIFSSMVTAFTPSNIAAAGSLIIVAVLYQTVGFALAWIVREIFYVPVDFQWGILTMGIISNWGNLPTAIIQTVGKDAPFNGTTDVELGVAYVSMFILVMNTVFFPLGVHKLCALDFKEENLLRDAPLPFRRRWGARMKRLAEMLSRRRDSTSGGGASVSATPDVEFGHADVEEKDDDDVPGALPSRPMYSGGAVPTKKASRAASFTSMMESTRPIPPTAPLDAADAAAVGGPHALRAVCSHHAAPSVYHHPASPVPSLHRKPIWKRALHILESFLLPASIAIMIAIPCSIVLPLKALFVNVDGWTGTKMPNGPDGKPPLAFITDTTTFIGGITVPANLILLGAGFARLKAPKRWKDQPVGAMLAMTVCKMILVPTFGVFLVKALRDGTSLYPKEDKMRTFAAILTSGTPAAINQLVVTQLYNPEGSAHTLAAFLLVQYLAMPVLSTTLAAVGLYISQQT